MLKEKITQKGDDLKMLQGHDRLAYLIDISRDVPSLPDEVKTEENRIRGCASNLWLIGGTKEDNTMIYKIDADAFITKGTAKLVTDLVNNCPKNEVANLTIKDFLPLGIKELLTMQRQNGLGSLIQRIVEIANTKGEKKCENQ
jgi:cysteine desulfuration protein SufE